MLIIRLGSQNSLKLKENIRPKTVTFNSFERNGLEFIVVMAVKTEQKPGPKVIKKHFMLNTAEHEIFPAYKC